MGWQGLFEPGVVWILIGLALLIAEFAVPGLAIAFFGLGALLVGAICFFADLSLNMQIVIFLAGSLGMLVSLRNSLARLLQGSASEAEMEDAAEVVGQRVQVVQAITPQAAGRVEFHGSKWRAESTESLPAGATVVIVGRDNLTLLVKPLETG
jgi:membrane protein implicated in regulation of membrane protease activity